MDRLGFRLEGFHQAGFHQEDFRWVVDDLLVACPLELGGLGFFPMERDWDESRTLRLCRSSRRRKSGAITRLGWRQ